MRVQEYEACFLDGYVEEQKQRCRSETSSSADGTLQNGLEGGRFVLATFFLGAAGLNIGADREGVTLMMLTLHS
jgi:hypothetical protein